MSGLKNLNTRLNYSGGPLQQNRMKEHKLKTLKKALIYSYQGATAILEDKREFRCLINPNKMSTDIDDKIISIPFEDVCLNGEGIQSIGMKPGHTFEWKENGTHWLVTLQYKTEIAYFRAQIREAKEEVLIENKKYWCYLRGPIEQNLIWAQAAGDFYNKLNYTLVMYITKDENTEEFFHRFAKLKIAGKPWEVQAIDNMSTEGIIQVALKETFQNSIEEQNKKDAAPAVSGNIIGDVEVKPYDIKKYLIKDSLIQDDGIWSTDSKLIKIIENTPSTVTIQVMTGRTGEFILHYNSVNVNLEQLIKIKSL